MACCVKAHDFHTDRAGSACLNLMLMSEEVDSRLSSSVIKVALNEHAQHGTLASID
jgi:hypothetical protein